jgi:hypothetical protein
MLVIPVSVSSFDFFSDVIIIETDSQFLPVSKPRSPLALQPLKHESFSYEPIFRIDSPSSEWEDIGKTITRSGDVFEGYNIFQLRKGLFMKH